MKFIGLNYFLHCEPICDTINPDTETGQANYKKKRGIPDSRSSSRKTTGATNFVFKRFVVWRFTKYIITTFLALALTKKFTLLCPALRRMVVHTLLTFTRSLVSYKSPPLFTTQASSFSLLPFYQLYIFAIFPLLVIVTKAFLNVT